MLGQGEVRMKATLDTSGVKTGMAGAGKEMTSSLGNVTQALNALGITVGLYKVVQQLREASAEARKFEEGMTNVYTLVGRESAVFGQLDDDILALKKDIPTLELNDLTAGLYNTISAGVDAEKSMIFMEGAAKAAAGGFAQVDSVVAGTAKILNAYNLEAEKTTYITDLGLKTVEKGIIRYDEYSHEISMIAGTAASAGVALEDLHASIATATKVQLPAQAIVGLRQAIIELTSDPEKMRAWNLEWNGIYGVMQQLKARGMKAEDWAELFPNVRASETMKVLYNNFDDLTAMQEEFADVAGTTAEKFGIAMDTDAAKAAKAAAAVERLKIKIGTDLNKAVAEFAQGSEAALDQFNENLEYTEAILGEDLPDAVKEAAAEFSWFSDVLFPIAGMVENLGKTMWELYKEDGVFDKAKAKTRELANEVLREAQARGWSGVGSVEEWEEKRERKARGKAGGVRAGTEADKKTQKIGELESMGLTRAEAAVAYAEGATPEDVDEYLGMVAAGDVSRGELQADMLNIFQGRGTLVTKPKGKPGKPGKAPKAPAVEPDKYRVEKGLGGAVPIDVRGGRGISTEMGEAEDRVRRLEEEAAREAELEAEYQEVVSKVQGLGDMFGSSAADALWNEGEDVMEQLAKTMVNTIVSQLVSYLVVQGLIAILRVATGGAPIPGFQHGGRSDRPAIFGEGPFPEWAIPENVAGLRMFLTETLPTIIEKEPALQSRGRTPSGDAGVHIHVADVDRTGLAFNKRAQLGAVSAGARRL